MTELSGFQNLAATMEHMVKHGYEEISYKMIFDKSGNKEVIIGMQIVSRDKDTDEIIKVTVSFNVEYNKTATILKESQEKKENEN